jgi:hypothetical protein
MNVYCNHHNEYGKCLEDDYMDSKEGRNPSGMVRVVFNTFTQAVPIYTLETVTEKDLRNECELNSLENQSAEC